MQMKHVKNFRSELINYRITFCPEIFNNRILILEDTSHLYKNLFLIK